LICCDSYIRHTSKQVIAIQTPPFPKWTNASLRHGEGVHEDEVPAALQMSNVNHSDVGAGPFIFMEEGTHALIDIQNVSPRLCLDTRTCLSRQTTKRFRAFIDNI